MRVVIFIGLLTWLTPLRAIAENPPNIVIIMADDLGYGDLGCYGSKRNRTPNIDSLAESGIRFTDYHGNGPMCTPTRVALLTGLYQQRFGVKFESALSGRAGAGDGLPLEAVTLAERLRAAGYATAMFGKWHLGYRAPNLPTRQGFDEFRGLLSGDGDHHSHIDRAGGEDWWHNEVIDVEHGYTADLITKHGIHFIETHRDQPFFLYLPHLAIHFPWQGPDDPPHRRAGMNYEQDKWGIISDNHHVASHVNAMVEALDVSVGQIAAALRRLGLDRRTFVLFTSDNGGYLQYGETHHDISSNGPLRGQKGDVFEGGHRVPAIASWPGSIPGHRVSDATIMSMDIMPTCLELAGIGIGHGPSRLDGQSLLGLLSRDRPLPDRMVFWRMRARAARDGPWKLVWPMGAEPSLFRLDEDLGESRDISASHPDRVMHLRAAIEAWENDVTPRSKNVND